MARNLCPECGSKKDVNAVMCQKCRYAERENRSPLNMSGADRAKFGAVVTFENEEGRRFMLHRVGGVKKALRQACEDALLLDQTFKVICVSTPATVFTDMQGARMSSQNAGFEFRASRAASPEAKLLGLVGMSEMLHPSLRHEGHR